MAPNTRSWVCPSCGTHNGSGEPAAAAATVATEAASAASTPSTGVPSPPSPSSPRAPSGGRSLSLGGDRLPLIVIAVVVIIAIVLVWVLLSRHKSAPPVATGSSPAPLTLAQSITKLCDDIPIDLNLRIDALNRTADQVRADAKAIRKAGDKATAKKAVAVASAMENFATTLATHGDTTEVTASLGAAIEAVKPSCS
jgi:hypothetical protein